MWQKRKGISHIQFVDYVSTFLNIFEQPSTLDYKSKHLVYPPPYANVSI